MIPDTPTLGAPDRAPLGGSFSPVAADRATPAEALPPRLFDAESALRALRQVARMLRRRRQIARSRRALAEMEPWLLRDIGLDAEVAAREARRPFWEGGACC